MFYLQGLGHFYPENVFNKDFLEALDIGKSERWILERVGIQTGRTVLDLDYIRTTKNQDPRGAIEASLSINAQTKAAAATMAMERAGIQPTDIGLVISGTCVPDNTIPAEAELGIDALCFHLSSSCTSFRVQIHFLEAMKPGALAPYILIVNPENMTKSVNYNDRNVAFLSGDAGSSAVILTTSPSAKRFSSCYCQSKPSRGDKVIIPRTGHFHQDSRAVQGFAIRQTTDSLRMMQTVCERADITEANHWHNVEHYGNTGCAGAPSVLSRHWDDLFPENYVAIALVGSGLTRTHVMLEVKEAA